MRLDNIEELTANVQARQQTNIPLLWKRTRLLLGYGVNELAKQLETSGAQISRIESGEREPSTELIIKFAQLKEQQMSNVRFLTSREIEKFPADDPRTPEVAIKSTDGNEYYGEIFIDLSGSNPQFLADEDGEYIPV